MIVITGSSGGIGQAILPSLLELGMTLPIYNKNTIIGAKLNLENTEDIKDFVKRHEETLHKITLIHLAAVKIDELAVFVNEDNWDKVMSVNLKGAFFLTKALLPIMQKERWGRIIFVLSSGLGDVGTLTYSISKYGLIGMSEVLAREYARYGITSNIIQLGYFNTGLYQKLSQEKQKELLEQIPSKQLGDVKDIVNAVEMIIKSPTINGAVVSVDGGI